MNRTLYLIILVAVVFFCSPALAQPGLAWAEKIGNSGSAYSMVQASDAAGNYYSAGFFTGILDVDPGPGVYEIVGSSGKNVFVVKLDHDGRLVWANDFAFSGAVIELNDMAIGTDGRVWLGGGFEGSLSVSINGVLQPHQSVGEEDVFLIRVNSQGEFVSFRTLGSSSNERLFGLELDGANELMVTGMFTGTLDLDWGPMVFSKSEAGNGDVFLVRYDASENFSWALTFGGPFLDRPFAIDLDSQGNIYLVGNFIDTVDFDPGPNVYNMTTSGGANVFCLKLSDTGAFVWAGALETSGLITPNYLSLDALGNVWIIGRFNGSFDADPGSGVSMVNNMTSNSGNDIFLVKLNAAGQYLWSGVMGGAGFDEPRGILADSNSEVWVIGTFEQTADFDPLAGTQNLTSQDGKDLFLAKLNGNGSLGWLGHFAGVGSESVAGLAAAPNGGVYLSGSFGAGTDFDPNAGIFPLAASGPLDAFFCRIANCLTSTSYLSPVVCDTFAGPNGVTYTESGTYQAVLTTGGGCDSVVNIQLTVNGPTGDVFNSGLALTSLDNGATYQWVDCSNGFAPIAGEVGQSFVPTANGSYALIVTMNGCTDTSACQTVTLTGISHPESGLVIQIYPNPSTGKVIVEVPGTAELAVFNSLGQIIHLQQMRDVAELQLPVGMYFVRIEQDGFAETRKVLIAP